MPDNNGALGTLFDILTTGSPLKTKPVRDAIQVIGSLLTEFSDPHAQGFGSSLIGLVKLFELRDKQKRKRSVK